MSDKVRQVRTFEVLTATAVPSRRAPRHWSDEEKARLVAEAFSPGGTVAGVARSYDLDVSQLFAWRRKGLSSGAIAPLAVPLGGRAGSVSEPVKFTRFDAGIYLFTQGPFKHQWFWSLTACGRMMKRPPDDRGYCNPREKRPRRSKRQDLRLSRVLRQTRRKERSADGVSRVAVLREALTPSGRRHRSRRDPGNVLAGACRTKAISEDRPPET